VIDLGKYIMDEKINNPQPPLDSTASDARRPNEQSRLYFDELLRISDPETKQVFVEQRA